MNLNKNFYLLDFLKKIICFTLEKEEFRDLHHPSTSFFYKHIRVKDFISKRRCYLEFFLKKRPNEAVPDNIKKQIWNFNGLLGEVFLQRAKFVVVIFFPRGIFLPPFCNDPLLSAIRLTNEYLAQNC